MKPLSPSLLDRRRSRGFTLFEKIMLVIAITTLVMTSGSYFVSDGVRMSRRPRVALDLSYLTTALEAYKLQNGSYPSTQQGLAALATAPTGEPKPQRWTPTLDKVVKDPWGRDYIYVRPGKKNPRTYDLISKGEDGIEGTADDLGNWDRSLTTESEQRSRP